MTKKYIVLGPRVLVKVRKFKDGDKAKPGSAIILSSVSIEQETVNQTTGEIVDLGPTALSEYKGFEILKIGQTVHFQRYGAMRVGIQDADDNEHWIINGKDILCIEENVVELTKEEVSHE